MKSFTIFLIALFALFTLPACEDPGGDIFEDEDVEDAGSDEDVPNEQDAYLADDALANDEFLGPLDEFAHCVTDSGAYLYGTSWDLFAENQRLKFNRSVDIIKYINCDLPEGKLLEICIEQGIEYTPTWILNDGEKVTGVHTLEEVAEMTGCELPSWTGEKYEDWAKIRLARNLTESGAVLYGVVNCSYCTLQKDMFGEEAAEYLNYFSCDSADAPWEIFQECLDLGLDAYPTWIFGDNSQHKGAKTLTNLANEISDDDWPSWGG